MQFDVTRFLEADSPEALSAMTMRMQLALGMELHFFDFSQTKKGTYICWFRVPHNIWAEKVANGKA